MDLSATHRNCLAATGLTLVIITFNYEKNKQPVKLLDENNNNDKPKQHKDFYPDIIESFKKFNLKKSIQINKKRVELYKSECENYYKEHKQVGEFVKHKNYTSIFMSITKQINKDQKSARQAGHGFYIKPNESCG